MTVRLSVSLLALALTTPAPAQDRTLATAAAETPLLRVEAAQATGKILVTLPRPDAEGIAGRYLYTPVLRSGLGAAPTSLDRGKIGETQLLAFRRIGAKIAIQYENPRFRVPNRPDVRSPDFATSVVWMGAIDRTNADGTIVVDIAPFLASDTLGIAAALGQEGGSLGGGAAQGAGRGFRLDTGLSAADPTSVKVFPRNMEVDSLQTFASDTPGAEVSNIAPEPRRVTLNVHHSFMALPEAGYVPRRADPRVAGFATQAVDYGMALGQDVVFDFANRFRLEKTDPGAALSRVKTPIIWYVDPAAPEPIRSALIEGANWWKAGFEAAGYIDAFDVRLLPEGADPLDARYSMITWVDRATRGWAYGQQVADPRTGEILRGMVVLGSERARQDIQIFQGLVDAALTGTGGPNDPAQVAIARLRQLAAHEVGHSIGFAHNFAASTQGRASVMDYPPPRIGLVGGKPDLSNAYGTGLGGWDVATVDWLYGDDATADAKAAAIAAKGWRYVPDDNARRADTAQPWGGLWDDGTDPIAELDRLMTVRRAAIAQFGERNLLPGEPVSTLRRRFVPIYLLHRYQLVAAAKAVGGVDFAYTVKGDPRGAPKAVPAATQRAAIAAVLRTISPEALRLPPALPLLLSAPRNGTGNRQFDIELFDTAGGPVFDPLVAADTATQLTLATLMAPSRLQRLDVQHAIDPTMPGVTALLDAVEGATLKTFADPLTRRIATRSVIAIAQAARNAATPPDAAALLSDRVTRVATRLAKTTAAGDEGAWAAGLSRQLLDPQTLATLIAERPRTPDVPPGDPIGDTDWMGPPGR
ncbi:zinc-dependent metalloprotease [uncultured Sphingomonas sp.]|uniref:zinc-dependent metalloprotease n=1 Tax=uncultured Sphingomonas sp. TaxID=158754 RepID=UPI0025D895EF|nr:zinc-dependent metalloprotease [uncultured Sphingomonas sp.]